MAHLRSILVVLLCVFACESTFAQIFEHISQKSGNYPNRIISISQDKTGFIWFATGAGLFRYDSQTFKKYSIEPVDNESIATNYITVVQCSSDGAVWVGTYDGLSRYDSRKASFRTFKHAAAKKGTVSSDTILSIAEDKQQNIWIGTPDGLDRISLKGEKTDIKHFSLRKSGEPDLAVQNIAVGAGNELWLATSNGLMRFEQGEIRTFKAHSDKRFPSTNDFKSIFLDDSGDNIWLGIRPGGLMRFNITSRSFELLDSFRAQDGTWPDISGFTSDKRKKLWIATMAGLVNFDPYSRTVKWYTNDQNNEQSLSENSVMCLFKDKRDGIWLGTYNLGVDYFNPASVSFSRWPFYISRTAQASFSGGWMGLTPDEKLWVLSADKKQLLMYDRLTHERTKHKLDLDFASGLNHFFIDENGVLWCGGNWLLRSYNLQNRARVDYPFSDRVDTPYGRGRIFRMIQDSKQQLWLCGSFGLLRFDKKTKTCHSTGIKTLMSNAFEDSDGNIWSGGIDEIWFIPQGTGDAKRIPQDEAGKLGDKGYRSTWRFAEDHLGRIWLATTEGLKLYHPKENKFKLYAGGGNDLRLDADDILTDKNGFLWLSREKDLVRYHPDKGTIQTYSFQDGLPKNSVLSLNTAAKDKTGMFFFNTSQEMVSLNPNLVSIHDQSEKIVLSSLKLFNKEVRSNDESGILQGNIVYEKELIFRHDQNIFTLDFALLSFFRSNQNKFQYQMEGFEKQWNETSIPIATYMNLPSGSYNFVVKAANGDGIWMKEPLRVRVTILSPWWKTWYAYLLYLIAIAGAMYLIIRFFWIRTSFRRESALAQSKLDFFTNVSHEIRTHLSLISGPLGKAYEQSQQGKQVDKQYLGYAKNNSDRLMLLVDELLDFRKMQSGRVVLHLAEHDVVRIIKTVTASFEHFGREKEIQTLLVHPDNPVWLWFDLNQMQKVFYNLLSNAYKFTPAGGTISVRVFQTADQVSIEVNDTGVGISPDHLDKLFTYYYQADSEKPGYGIGLALSKSIVEQHHGYLEVDSRVATGSVRGGTTLIVRMKAGNLHFSREQISNRGNNTAGRVYEETLSIQPAVTSVSLDHKNTILIIEDNDQLRVFIRELFDNKYNTIEAENGIRGLELANEHLPDIILTDVMMPEMNGLELCNRIKNSENTSHIPVVLLTARTQNDQVVEGLLTGADDYLAKPFDSRILELKISNLIQVRDQMKARYRQSVLEEDSTGNNLAQDRNELFIGKLRALIMENISNPNFGVNDLSVLVGMSVSVLYRKMRSLTDMTINEFVKAIRLAEAQRLLQTGVYQVGEVATMVGFEDSKYFSKEFRKAFGLNPKDIKKKGHV